MTLDELKVYQDQVANHHALPSNVMDALFKLAETAIEADAPLFPEAKPEATAPVVKKSRSKTAD